MVILKLACKGARGNGRTLPR